MKRVCSSPFRDLEFLLGVYTQFFYDSAVFLHNYSMLLSPRYHCSGRGDGDRGHSNGSCWYLLHTPCFVSLVIKYLDIDLFRSYFILEIIQSSKYWWYIYVSDGETKEDKVK